MKSKLFNVVVYSMLGWSIVSAGYLALPIEYQEMLPQMNWIIALVSGGSTALLGTGGLVVQSFISKTKLDTSNKINEISNVIIQLVDEYKTLKTEYKNLQTENAELKNAILENNKLLKIDLKTKLDNPMTTNTARVMIEGVINESKKE